MAYLLDSGATITCPHGGTASVSSPVNSQVTTGGTKVLVVGDLATVAGCTFNVSGAPSPCVRIDWKAAAQRVELAGQAALLSSSVALCVNAAGAPQGKASVSGFQTRASGQ